MTGKVNMIDAFNSGRIIIDGKVYTNDVIIFPDRVDSSWWRKEGHNLCIEDMEPVMTGNPEVVVIGTGVRGLMRVPQETKHYVESKGAQLLIEPTRRACDIYNEVSRDRKAVAALHLTC